MGRKYCRKRLGWEKGGRRVLWIESFAVHPAQEGKHRRSAAPMTRMDENASWPTVSVPHVDQVGTYRSREQGVSTTGRCQGSPGRAQWNG